MRVIEGDQKMVRVATFPTLVEKLHHDSLRIIIEQKPETIELNYYYFINICVFP